MSQAPYVRELYDDTTEAHRKALKAAYGLFRQLLDEPEVNGALAKNRFKLMQVFSSYEVFSHLATSVKFGNEPDEKNMKNGLWTVHVGLTMQDRQAILKIGPESMEAGLYRMDGTPDEKMLYARNAGQKKGKSGGTLSFYKERQENIFT